MIRDCIGRYFENTKQYSTRRFILEMALIPFPLKLLLGVAYALLGGEVSQSTTDAIAGNGILTLVIAAVIIAPLIETFVGQWLPIWIVSLFTKRVANIVVISAVIFALQHLHVGFSGFLTALPVAIFLSWCFVVGRSCSLWKSIWTTAAVHAVHNSCAVFLYCLIGS